MAKNTFSPADSELVDIQVLNLTGMQPDEISTALSEIQQSNQEKIVLKIPDDFSKEQEEALISIIDKNVYLQKIILSGNIEDKVSKQILDVQNRNKLIAYYEINRDGLDEPWKKLVDVHFKDYNSSGRYDLIKNYRDPNYVQAMTDLGATWHNHFFSYLSDNQAQFEITGFPYTRFSPALNSDSPYDMLSQVQAFNNYLKEEEAYLPFREIDIQATTLDKSQEYFDAFNNSVQKLFESAEEHGVEKITINYVGMDSNEFNENLPQLFTKLLNAAKEGKITTQIYLGRSAKLNEESQALFSQLENQVQHNIRTKNKLMRAGHYSEEKKPSSIVVKTGRALKKEEIRACKRNAAGMLEHVGVEIQMQQQQQQQQQQQEQQQIQMQAQRDQLLDALNQRKGKGKEIPDVDPKGYIDFNKFVAMYENNPKYTRSVYTSNRGYKQISDLWNNMAGEGGFIKVMRGIAGEDQFPPIISGISKTVAELLVVYPQLFVQGLNLNDLPPGFVLKKSKDNSNHLILDYDSAVAKLVASDPEKQSKLHTTILPSISSGKPDWKGDQRQFSEWPESPLTADDMEELAGLGLKKVFPKGTQEEKIDLLLKLMKNENLEIGTLIESNYKPLLNLFKNEIELISIANVIYIEGCQGAKILLDKLDEMRARLGDGATEKFISQFLGKYPRNISELMNNDSLAAIDKLIELTPGEYAWWASLNEQEGEYNQSIHFVDQLEAFLAFKEKLKSIDENLIMESPCPLENVKNMKVALSRVLDIVNNAIDPLEQFYHLKGLKLGQYDAFHAMQEKGYFFVSSEMNLDVERLDLIISNDDTSRNLYEIKLEDFESVNDSAKRYDDYRAHYFRLLGQQVYLDKYEKYKDLIERLDYYNGQYTASLDISSNAIERLGIEASSLGKPDSIPKTALGLLALATTHKDALGTVSPVIVDHVFNAFHEIENLPTKDRKIIESALLSYCAQERAQVAMPIGHQLPALIAFHHELGVKHEWNGEPANIMLISQNYFEVIDTRFKVNQKFKGEEKLHSINQPISAKELVVVIKSLSQSESLNKDEHKQSRDQLLKLSVLMRQSGFSQGAFDNLLNIVCDGLGDAENAKKIQIALDILTSIDPMHEKTKDLPDMAQFANVLSDIISDKSVSSYSDIFKLISRSSGFENCYFANNNAQVFDPDAAKKMIAENKEEIKNALTELGLQIEDSDLEDPQALLEKIKSVADRIPFLSVVLGKFVSNERDNHYGFVNEYAKTKLNIEDSSVEYKTLSSIIENQLFHKDIRKHSTVEETLATLQSLAVRNSDVTAFIDSLSKIKSRSGTDFKKIVEALNAGHAVSEIPIANLTRIIDAVSRTYKKDFAHEVLDAIINNNAVKSGTINNWDMFVDKHLRDMLLNADKLSVSDMKNSINLMLNLIGNNANKNEIESLNSMVALNHTGASALIEFFNKSYDESIFKEYAQVRDCTLIHSIFRLTKGIESQPIFLSEQINTVLASQCQKNPHALLQALPNLLAIADSDKEQKAEMIASLISILGRLQPNDYVGDKPQILFSELVKKDAEFLIKLAKFDEDLGFPSADIVLEAIQNNQSIDELIESRILETTQERNKLLSEQFGDLEVHRVIEGMTDLSRENRLMLQQRKDLQQQFYFINAIGHTHAISTNLNNRDAPEKTVKDMSKQEINQLLKQHKDRYRDPTASDKQKQESRLVYLALLRECMYRTTGRLPYSTQILSVLLSMNKSGNHIAEIQTGQGKSLMSALNAAMLELDGQAVDVCTSNLQLAKESLEENIKFYQYAGLKVGVIDASSPLEDYQRQGINYSDVAQLSLFRARAQIEGWQEPQKASLVLDEADYTLLDDTTQYRYAVNLDDVGDPTFNPYGWVYDLVNQFIETDSFNDPNASIQDDVMRLRAYLIEHALGPQKNLIKDPNQITDKQLDIWIDSAVAARELYKQRDVRWTLREEESFGKKISVARLIVNDRVSPDAQWSNGVQQLLHARVNANDPDIRDGKKPKCALDPEKQAVASATSKNFIDYYNQKGGRVCGMTGTIGSVEERTEHNQKFGFSMTSVPSHQGQRRVDRTPIMVDTDEEHQQKIFAEILKRIRSNDKMPVLIICKDAPTSEALSKYIEAELSKQRKHYPLTLQLFNGVNNAKVDFSSGGKQSSALFDETAVRDQAGKQGTITISTPMMGRGTDFKPEKRTKQKQGESGAESWIKHPNGLFVMQTYVDTERTSRQIIGRSGRQGWFGESMTVVSKQALERDFGLVGQRDIQIQSVQSGIDELRSIQNLSAKERRTLSESYGDVRAQFFSRMLQLLDRVPEYREEQDALYEAALLDKDADLEQFDMRSSAEIRKSMMKGWESFMNDLDLEWKKILTEQEKPEAEACLNILAGKAVQKWDDLIRQHLPVTQKDGNQVINIKVSQDDMKDLIQQVMASRNKISAPSLPDSYQSIPKTINIHKAVCDTSTSPALKTLTAARDTELKFCLDKLIDISKHNRRIKVKIPKKWDTMKPEEKYGFLHTSIQNILSSGDKLNTFQSLTQVRLLERDLKTLSVWVDSFPALKDSADQIKAIQFYNDLHERNRLIKTSPHKIVEHDQEMLARQVKGLYPKQAFTGYLNTREATLVERVRESMLGEIKTYQSAYFKSKTRKNESDKLQTALISANTYNEFIDRVIGARESVFNKEKKPDLSGRFFAKTNRILDILIANATSAKDINRVKSKQIEDVFNLLAQVQNQCKDNQVKLLIGDVIRDKTHHDDLTKLNQKLSLIRGALVREPNLSQLIDAKLNQNIRLQQREMLMNEIRIEPEVIKPELQELPQAQNVVDSNEDALVIGPSHEDNPLQEMQQSPQTREEQAVWKKAQPQRKLFLNQLQQHIINEEAPEKLAKRKMISECQQSLKTALREIQQGKRPDFCQDNISLPELKIALEQISKKLELMGQSGDIKPESVARITFEIGVGHAFKKEHPLNKLKNNLSQEGQVGVEQEASARKPHKPGGSAPAA